MSSVRKILSLSLLMIILIGCTNSPPSNSIVDSSQTPAKESSVSKLTQKWIDSCELDYKSEKCNSAMQEMLIESSADFEEFPLHAFIPPYKDPEKSQECIKDSKSESCENNRFGFNISPTDFECGRLVAFGVNYYCWGSIIIRNLGNSPVDEYFEVSLYDQDGVRFASDLEGSFNFNSLPIQFEEEPKIQLNPEGVTQIYIGFSVPDIERNFTYINMTSWSKNFSIYIPLCKKSRGDFAPKLEDGKFVTYENARLLNSCFFDLKSQNYAERKI